MQNGDCRLYDVHFAEVKQHAKGSLVLGELDFVAAHVVEIELELTLEDGLADASAEVQVDLIDFAAVIAYVVQLGNASDLHFGAFARGILLLQEGQHVDVRKHQSMTDIELTNDFLHDLPLDARRYCVLQAGQIDDDSRTEGWVFLWKTFFFVHREF